VAKKKTLDPKARLRLQRRLNKLVIEIIEAGGDLTAWEIGDTGRLIVGCGDGVDSWDRLMANRTKYLKDRYGDKPIPECEICNAIGWFKKNDYVIDVQGSGDFEEKFGFSKEKWDELEAVQESGDYELDQETVE